jgi:arylsulfatase A-like enzyme
VNPSAELRRAALAVASAVLAAASALGLVDVALRGSGLDAGSAAGTVLLWIALAVAPAVAAGIGVGALAAALRGRSEPRNVASAALAVALLGLALAGHDRGLIGSLGAASLGLAALGTPELLRRRPRWMTAVPPLAVAMLVLGPLAATGLGGLRSEPARLPPATRATHAVNAGGTGGASEPRPHVVLIVLDTLRADHLGAYGSRANLSPSFDRLASEGTLYERCYAPAPWTVPSHASLFTGLYPGTHGASFAHHRWLDDDFTTLAEALRAAGYRTAGFSANAHVGLANLAQGFEIYREFSQPFQRLALRKPLSALGAPARWIDDGAEQGVREIETFLSRFESHAAEAPLFLFVNLLEPHWRYLPPLAERRAQLPPGMSYLEATRHSAGFYGPLAMARPASVSARARDAIRALYAADVSYQDVWLGRLVAAIDRSLGREDTLLIITADHGENLGEGDRWDHVFAVNDHLIHVPMLVRRETHVAAGKRESALCQLVDVPATIAGAAGGLTLDPRQAGIDLLAPPAAARQRRHAFAESEPYLGHLERMSFSAGFERDVARFAATLSAAHDGRFKYVASTRGAAALFDLQTDPHELSDVSADHPQRASELAAALARWQAKYATYSLADDAAGGIADDERARLESLGYVQ